jgi:endo-1,4-beta-xylanase
LVAGCGDASPEGGSADVPVFQGGIPEGPLPPEEAPPAPEDENMAAATPGGVPGDSTQEGTPGDIALEPSDDGTEPPGDGETTTPDGMGMPGDMVPVVTGPPPKFVGNITTGNSVDTNGLVFSDYWDQITPENAGKWGSVQRTAGAEFNWAALDAIYDYTEQKGIVFKEHTFVWGPQQPTGDLTEADVQNWMREFCARYPNTRLIDVVNEPPPHTEPSYTEAIGGGTDGNWQWIVNAFTWAREYCPNATLILNDFNNIEIGNQNQHFIDIVKTIQAGGAPIDAVGAQAHGLSGANSTPNMINLLTKLHDDTGLPVYITEYDINQNDDTAQRDRVQEQVSFFLDTEWIHGVTVWGWIFGRTWVASSGLIRDGAPRPAMVWLMEELGRPVPQ